MNNNLIPNRDNFFDNSFENRLSKREQMFCVTKNMINIPDNVYANSIRPTQQRFNGTYIPQQGDQKQVYAFHEKGEAQGFAQELFLKTTPASELNNKKIPFSDLVVRKDDFKDGLFHILKDTPDNNGNYPLLAYYDAKDQSLRSPLVSQQQTMHAEGNWSKFNNGSCFYFKSAADLVNFSNTADAMNEFNNHVVIKRYDDKVANELKQYAENNAQSQQQTTNPNVQARSNTSSDDNGDSDNSAKAETTAVASQNPKQEQPKSGEQLDLFSNTEESPKVTTTLNTENNGTDKPNIGEQHPNDEDRNSDVLNDKTVHDTRTNQPNVSDVHDGLGRGTNGGTERINDILSPETAERPGGTALHTDREEINTGREGRSEGTDAVENRRSNTAGMGSDGETGGNGNKSEESNEGNDTSISARSGRVLPDTTVQSVSKPDGEGLEQSQDASIGNDNSRVQPVLKKEDAIKNQNSWFASEHPIDIPQAGTAEALDTNIKALEVLASVIEEKRTPTQDEQDTLAKYTGFGNTPINFISDPAFPTDNYNRHLGETDTKRYNAVKDACDRIEKATNIMEPEELQKIGLKESVSSYNLRNSLQRSMLTAFYTDKAIVNPMWDLVKQLGFKGGSILDPCAGNARFESNMPKDIAEKSDITLIDKDTLSAMIASQLHPDARTINTGYEDFSQHNKFDLTISNDPFNDERVVDAEWQQQGRLQKPEYKNATSNLTSYFPAKKLDNLNDGGLIAYITTSNFLDSKSHESTRRLLASQAEFIGGIRLPMNTFKNADVQSDILFFRKFNKGEKHEQNLQFVNTEEKLNPYFSGWNRAYSGAKEFVENGGNIKDFKEYKDLTKSSNTLYTFNEYFDKHPENIIGTQEETFLNNTKRPAFNSSLSIEEIGQEVQKRVDSIVVQYKENHQNKELNIESQTPPITPTAAPSLVPSALQKKIDSFNEIREDLDKLFKAYETDDKSQVELRNNLNNHYNQFVRDYGPILSKKNEKDLNNQYGFAKVASIENWEQASSRSKKYTGKADVFFKNTIHPVAVDIQSENPQDIINHSLHKFNRIDTDLMKEKLGDNWEQKTKGLIFLDPVKKEYIPSAYYLGGDVKTKLAEAKSAVAYDKRFQDNVDALNAVQPERIPLNDIVINFGSNFVPSATYTAYIKETVFKNKDLSDDACCVGYNGSSAGSAYNVHLSDYLAHDKTLSFGTDRSAKNAHDILESAFSDNHLTIYYPKENPKDPNEKRVQDEKATFAANAKIDEIRDGFINWLAQPQNNKYAKEIEDIYNEQYNRTQPIKYDANFVEPVGCTMELRQHQKSAVARILTGNDTLIDHPVGYGKTAVMIAGIQEQHRLGLSQKSLLICMKVNVKQIAQEYHDMYPNANILFPTDKDFSAKNRNALLNKIKTNQYDCVILTHDQYSRLSHSPEIQQQILEQRLNEYKSAIDADETKKSPSTKKLMKEQGRLEAKIKDIANMPHDPVAFEELGFDKLFVDESHQFKNLQFITNHHKVAGLGNPQGSKRADNLLYGIRHIQNVNGGDRGVVFATGTPITNSIVELFNIQQFLTPNMLKEHNHQSFDAWALQYAQKTEEMEVQPSMAIKTVDRFRTFCNIPELQKDYISFADVPDPTSVQFEKPLENRMSVTVPSGGEQHMTVLKELKHLTETGESYLLNIHLDDDKKSARSLVATSAGAKEAISAQFLGIDSDPESDKATAIARQIAEKYNQTDEHKGVQLVFSEIVGKGKAMVIDPNNTDDVDELIKQSVQDWKVNNYKEKFSEDDKAQCLADLQKQLEDQKITISASDINKHWSDEEEGEGIDESQNAEKISKIAGGSVISDYNLFTDIKSQLVKKYGIPENEVVSIRDYSPTKRKEIFDKANKGEVRVIMGSTQTLGTGVNVQKRVVAMHHADVPWTPAAVEQRTGRGVRQGNEVAKIYGNQVDNIFYLKEKSCDAKKFNLLDIKANFINGFKNGSAQNRTMDTQEQSADKDFQEFLDITLGNPLFHDLMTLKGKETILLKERTAFNAQTFTLSSELSQTKNTLDYNRSQELKWKGEAKYMLENSPAKVDNKLPIDMKVNGVQFTSAKDAGNAIFRSTALGNKTSVEAYGYTFSITKSLEPGKDLDRVISITSRTGNKKEEENDLLFNDLRNTITGKFTLNSGVPKEGQQVNEIANMHIAMAVRGLVEDIERKGVNYQQNKVQLQQQVHRLEEDLKSRETFPKAKELLEVQTRIQEINQQLNGKSSLDLKNWTMLSNKWNGEEGNSEKLEIPKNGSILDIKDNLFGKYLDMAHEEGSVRNSLDMQRYDFKQFSFNGKSVELAGPLTIDKERIKAILPYEYTKSADTSTLDSTVNELNRYFIAKSIDTVVKPLQENGYNPSVAFVETPDFSMRNTASDSALKENHINAYVEENNPALIISGENTTSAVAELDSSIQVDFYQIKPNFRDFVTNSFVNELRSENDSLNINAAQLVHSYESQSKVADNLLKDMDAAGWKNYSLNDMFPANVSYSVIDVNDNQAFRTHIVNQDFHETKEALDFTIKIDDLQTLLEGKNIHNTNAHPSDVDADEEDNEEAKATVNDYIHIDSLQETYKNFIKSPENENLEYDADGAVKFIHDFTTQASIIEQQQHVVAYNAQAENIKPEDISSDKLFTLLSSNTKELAVNYPQADGQVHLLASPKTGTVIPDPYVYANSAEELKGDDIYKITISDKDARTHAEEISVWAKPAETHQNNFDAFLEKTKGLNVNIEKLTGIDQLNRVASTFSADTHQMGEASLHNEYYSGKDHLELIVNLDPYHKDEITSYNSKLPYTTVGIYQKEDDTAKQRLQLYPIVQKPAFDLNGNKLKFIGSATFETKIAVDNRFHLYALSINPSHEKTINVNSDDYIAGVKLDEADKQNLKTLGITDHSISLTSPSGKNYNYLLSAVPEAGFPSILKVSAYDPSSLKIDEQKQVANGISDTQIQQLKEGKSVECKINGATTYLMINPASGSVSALNQKPAFAERNELKQEIKEENAAEKQAPYKDFSQNNEDSNHGHKLSK